MSEDTRITAELPNVTMEIERGQAEDGKSETVAIRMTAKPNIDAAAGMMVQSMPALLMQAAMSPGLGSMTAAAPWLALMRGKGPVVGMPTMPGLEAFTGGANPMDAWSRMVGQGFETWLAMFGARAANSPGRE